MHLFQISQALVYSELEMKLSQKIYTKRNSVLKQLCDKSLNATKKVKIYLIV
jgi:hypothetical protein